MEKELLIMALSIISGVIVGILWEKWNNRKRIRLVDVIDTYERAQESGRVSALNLIQGEVLHSKKETWTKREIVDLLGREIKVDRMGLIKKSSGPSV